MVESAYARRAMADRFGSVWQALGRTRVGFSAR
jgi:hypothetical protein